MALSFTLPVNPPEGKSANIVVTEGKNFVSYSSVVIEISIADKAASNALASAQADLVAAQNDVLARTNAKNSADNLVVTRTTEKSTAETLVETRTGEKEAADQAYSDELTAFNDVYDDPGATPQDKKDALDALVAAQITADKAAADLTAAQTGVVTADAALATAQADAVAAAAALDLAETTAANAQTAVTDAQAAASAAIPTGLDLGEGWSYNSTTSKYNYILIASKDGTVPADLEIPVNFPKVLDWSGLTVTAGSSYFDKIEGSKSWAPANPGITVLEVPTLVLTSDVQELTPGSMAGTVVFTLAVAHLDATKDVTVTLADGLKYFGDKAALESAGWSLSGTSAIRIYTPADIANFADGKTTLLLTPPAGKWPADGTINISVTGGGTAEIVVPAQDQIVTILGSAPHLYLEANDPAVIEAGVNPGDVVNFDLNGRNLNTDGYVTATLADALKFFESESQLRADGWVLAADGSASKVYTGASVNNGAAISLTLNVDADWSAGGTIGLTVTGAGVTTAVSLKDAVKVNVPPAVTLTPSAPSVVEGYAVDFVLDGKDLEAGEDVTVTLDDALRFFSDAAAVDAAGWTLRADGTAIRTFTVSEDGTVDGTITLKPNATHDWIADGDLKLTVTGASAGIIKAVEQAVKVTLRRPDVPGGDDIVDVHVAGDHETTTIFPDKLSDYGLTWANGSVFVEGTGAATDEYVGFQRIQLADGVIDLATPSWLFDPVFYTVANADVYGSKLGAYAHFEKFGEAQERDPNAFFNAKGYLAVNQDVAAARLTAFDHYFEYGAAEGRDTALNFDARLYLQNNKDVAAAGFGALEHYLVFGQVEGRATYTAIGETIESDSFDEQYYLFANADVVAAGLDARAHFAEYGYAEGRLANAFFDPAYYLAQNVDVKNAGIDPLTHYNEFGWREGRAASEQFDTQVYLDNYADVAAADINPLKHYLEFGIYENRSLDDIHAV